MSELTHDAIACQGKRNTDKLTSEAVATHADVWPYPGGGGMWRANLEFVPATPRGPEYPRVALYVLTTEYRHGRVCIRAREPGQAPEAAYALGAAHILRVGTATPVRPDGGDIDRPCVACLRKAESFVEEARGPINKETSNNVDERVQAALRSQRVKHARMVRDLVTKIPHSPVSQEVARVALALANTIENGGF